MKTPQKTLLAALLTLTPLASSAQASTPMLAVDEVSAIAKGAIADEVADLNAGLRGGAGAENSRYSPASLSALTAIGKTSIDEAYLFEKCVYTSDHLTSLLDNTLSLDDDAAAARRGSLAGMKSLYGARLWKLIARACVSAEERFYERLTALTVAGQPLSMDESTASQLTRVLFYPTELGRPSVKRTALSVLGTVLTGAIFIGSSGTLIGLPIGGLILKLAIPANSALGLRAAFARSEAPIRQADGLLLTSTTWALDLTVMERRCLARP
jgi:hypothetical protein